jgi:hypothetical protein
MHDTAVVVSTDSQRRRPTDRSCKQASPAEPGQRLIAAAAAAAAAAAKTAATARFIGFA